ncbi:glycosyltransferase family 8 protein, partial [Algoriella sp.]
YTAVVIQSIISNSISSTQYEINVLTEYISEENKAKGYQLIKAHKNFNLNFIYLDNLDTSKFYLNSYMNASTYYRFYIPELFKNYDRILYLDSDLIIDNDISFYTTIDFENKVAITSPSIYVQRILTEQSDALFTLAYFNQHLQMNDISQYFNAGVMLLNLAEIREKKIDQKLFDSINQIKKPIFQDQDLFNSVFYRNGGVKMISNEFNNPITYKITYFRILLNAIKSNFLNKKRNNWFTIYHYVGKTKPWQISKIDSSLFLYYAFKTSFISTIIKNNPNLRISNLDKFKLKLISYF